MAPFFSALCSKRIIKSMNHQPGREIEQKKKWKSPYLRQGWQRVMYCSACPRLCSVPWAQHPTKDAAGIRLYLFCSTSTSSRSLFLSTSSKRSRTFSSVISPGSSSQLELAVPADLRKAQAQRVCSPLLKWKKWNKGRIWALSPIHLSEGESRMQSQAHYLPPAPISRLQ